MPQQETITLPLPSFLEILFGHREAVYPDASVVEILRAIPNIESYCHIQLPGELPPDFDTKIPKVWQLDAWRNSYERWNRIKAVSSQERVVSNLGRELKEELIKAVMTGFGIDDRAIAEKLAGKMIDNRNVVGAKRLGIDITPLIDEIEKLKSV